MTTFFSRERFGRPQVLAGFLLLIFLAECLWLVGRSGQRTDNVEMFRIRQGLQQWRGQGIAGSIQTASINRDELSEAGMDAWQATGIDGYDRYHSPLWYLIASAPLLVWPESWQTNSVIYWGWLARAPYILFGLLLGASLWYVSRRLYGNAGGYIALALYCFSPGIIRSSSLWFAQPEMGAAWAAFGAIFTAIAVAHTLYAPREVVLWNWRRTLLLGLSLTLAIGSQFSLVIVIPLTLAFMLYLAPARRSAALAIWAVACGIPVVLLLASYFFNLSAFWDGLRQANFFGTSWQAFRMPGAYRELLAQLGQISPALLIALPVAVITYTVWPRTRYFGNTAPLLVALLFLLFSLGAPHYPGLGFLLMAVPFLFAFVAGVTADLLETRHRGLALACIFSLLAANAAWNLWELARAGRA
jgi:hypothetical protein